MVNTAEVQGLERFVKSRPSNPSISEEEIMEEVKAVRYKQWKRSFSAIWGNGMEAPKGESKKDDISFLIDIERASKTFLSG